MKLITPLLIVLLRALPLNAISAPLAPAEETIRHLLEFGSSDLSIVTPELRPAVVEKMREVARRKGGWVLLGTTTFSPMEADLLLLRLGDKFTIERMMEDYRAYDSRTSWSYVTSRFEYSQQPLIIPYLAEDFYSQENPQGGITIKPPPESMEFAVGAPPRSIFSGVVTTRIIEKAPEFSAEMKAWATQAYVVRQKSPERFRNLMRHWWDTNKAAFERGDYAAVVPVAEPPPATPKPATPPPATPLPNTPTPPATPAASPLPPPAATPALISGTEWKTPVWPWFAGLGALLALLAVMLKRRA
jgi:hypothetical protein